MKKKESKTAAELMSQLRNNPSYSEKKQSRAKAAKLRNDEYERIEARILQDITNAGFKLLSLDELLHTRPRKEVVEILLSWLPNINNEDVQETIVRSLAASNIALHGTVLPKVFEQAKSEALRWAVANTIAEARPSDISEWVLDAFRNEKYGKSREMLALAVARLVAPAAANEALVSMFEEFPVHVSMALSECGGPVELEYLQTKKGNYKGWIRKEIDKSIGVLKKG